MKDMKNKKKIVTLSLLVLFILPQISFASDMLDVSYDGQPGPLFNVENGAPGGDNIKTVSVTNNDSVFRDFGIDVDGDGSILSDVLILSIDGNGMPLSDYYSAPDNGIVWLGQVSANTTRDFEFKLTLDENGGNDFQGLDESFSFNLGFDEKVSEEGEGDSSVDGVPASGSGTTTTTTTTTTSFGSLATTQFAAVGGEDSDDSEQNDQGEVKGEEDVAGGQNGGDVKGEEEPGPKTLILDYWWISLILLLAIIIFILWRLRDKIEEKS